MFGAKLSGVKLSGAKLSGCRGFQFHYAGAKFSASVSITHRIQEITTILLFITKDSFRYQPTHFCLRSQPLEEACQNDFLPTKYAIQNKR